MTDAPSKYKSVREWIEARRRAQNPVAAPPLLDPPPLATEEVAEDGRFETTGALRSSTMGELISNGQTHRFAVGSNLGSYLLTEQIGRGGTALVFRGLHRTLKKPVALKVLHVAQP